MPWTAAQAKQKRKGLTDKEATTWAQVANSALASCLAKNEQSQQECEASAIKQAHSVINKMRRESVMKTHQVQVIREHLFGLQIVENSFDDSNHTFVIKVIQTGRSKNNTIYSESNMREIQNFLVSEGSGSHKMYIDHTQVSQGQYPGRGIEEWAATVLEAWVGDNGASVMAKVKVTPYGNSIYEMAKDPDHAKELGVSIHAGAIANQTDKAEDGKPGVVITQVVHLYSVDFVTEASAGGGVVYENIDKKRQRALVDEAYEIANAAGNPNLISILESIYSDMGITDKPKTDDKSTNKNETDVPSGKDLFEGYMNDEPVAYDDEGNIVPFSTALKNQQNEDDARETWYNMYDYLRDLAFNTEIDVTARVTAAQDAVKITFERINALLNDSDNDNNENSNGNRGDTNTQESISEAIQRDLIDRGILPVENATIKILDDLKTRGFVKQN